MSNTQCNILCIILFTIFIDLHIEKWYQPWKILYCFVEFCKFWILILSECYDTNTELYRPLVKPLEHSGNSCKNSSLLSISKILQHSALSFYTILALWIRFSYLDPEKVHETQLSKFILIISANKKIKNGTVLFFTFDRFLSSKVVTCKRKHFNVDRYTEVLTSEVSVVYFDQRTGALHCSVGDLLPS